MDLEMVLKQMLGAYWADEGSEAHRPCGAMNTGRDTWPSFHWLTGEQARPQVQKKREPPEAWGKGVLEELGAGRVLGPRET